MRDPYELLSDFRATPLFICMMLEEDWNSHFLIEVRDALSKSPQALTRWKDALSSVLSVFDEGDLCEPGSGVKLFSTSRPSLQLRPNCLKYLLGKSER